MDQAASDSSWDKSLSVLDSALSYLNQYAEADHIDLGGRIARLRANQFNISVFGGLGRGKSTVLNALMSTSILPMKISASQTQVVEIVNSPEISVSFPADKNTLLTFTEISEVREFLQTEMENPQHDWVTLTCPHQFADHISLIDTPAFDSCFSDLAQNVLSKTDMVLFVFSATEQLASEIEFYRDICRDYKVITIINRIDEINSRADVTRVRAYLEEILADDLHELFLVSGYLALLGRQIANGWLALESAQAEDRRLQIYTTPDTLLEASGIIPLENKMLDGLVEYQNESLRQTIQLAARQIEQLSVEILTTRQAASQQSQARLVALRRACETHQNRIEVLTRKKEALAAELAKAVTNYQRTALPAMLKSAHGQISDYITGYLATHTPIEIKQSVNLNMTTKWRDACSSVEKNFILEGGRIKKWLDTELKEDSGKKSRFPAPKPNFGPNIKRPWSNHSGSAHTASGAILDQISVAKENGLLGEFGKLASDRITNIWKSMDGTMQELKDAFLGELETAISGFSVQAEKEWRSWSEKISLELNQAYAGLLKTEEVELAAAQEELQKTEQILAALQTELTQVEKDTAAVSAQLQSFERDLYPLLVARAAGIKATRLPAPLEEPVPVQISFERPVAEQPTSKRNGRAWIWLLVVISGVILCACTSAAIWLALSQM